MLIDLKQLVRKYNISINGIIHGGAHMAEEKSLYSELGVKKVIWIEGNPEIFDRMKALPSVQGDIFFNELLWESSGNELEFHISNNGQSSSILDLDKHLQYHPEVHYIKTIKKTTITLDELFRQNNLNINDYNFVNLDLQGVELNVLKGFKSNLDKIKYIYTEVNTGEVYKNCSKMNELDDFLKQFGFKRVETNLTRAEWGDALYIKA